MNITLKKEDIFPILSQIQGILERRSTLPVFANALFFAEKKDKITIYASDSELSFSADFPAQVQETGKLVVDGKRLFEIVRELSDEEFHLSSKKNHQVTVKQNQSLFKIRGLNPEDYPAFPSFKQEKSQKILAHDMLSVIDKTLYSVSLDESRYHLTGVFLEQIASKYRFVATDGHRLSFVDIKGAKDESLKEGIIIPRKGLQEVKKMLSLAEEQDYLEISIEKPRILIRFKNQSLNVRLIEGEYPPYKKLLPEKKGEEARLSLDNFLSALKRTSVLTSARFKGVTFTFQANKLSIYFSQPEEGVEASEDIDCHYSGKKKLSIRFNSKYILDILRSLSEKEVKISLTGSNTPGLIQPVKDKNHTCLVMPMKLNGS